MADIHAWIDTVAVVIAAAAFWRDANQRELTNIFTLDEKNESFWENFYGREDIKRIQRDDVDLEKDPPTFLETKALVRAFVKYQTSWKAARIAYRSELNPLGMDLAELLSHPIPKAIWEQEKRYKSPAFVRFVKRAVERESKRTQSAASSHT